MSFVVVAAAVNLIVMADVFVSVLVDQGTSLCAVVVSRPVLASVNTKLMS